MERRRKGKLSEEVVEELMTEKTVDSYEDLDLGFQKPAKCGRPGKFQEWMVDEIFRLAQFGLTNEQIAKFYGMNVFTLRRFTKLYPELDDQLQQGRLISSMKVVESLYKQALGTVVEEEVEEFRFNKDGEKYLYGTKRIRKQVPASAVAGTFLLRTRHPDRWSETQKIEQNINTTMTIDMTDVSTDELMLIKKLGLKAVPTTANAKLN